MPETPFPATTSDVVALTVPEFTRALDASGPVSLDSVCRRYLDDANRALVWFIRFHALTAWRERPDMCSWLQAEPSHAQHACQVAAGFALNDAWEFDAERFRSAVECARASDRRR
jgi:hypothetical protein